MSAHVRSRVLLSFSVAMLLIIVPMTSFAATQGSEPVGRMTANAAGLSFQIGSDNESVTLTISGPNNFQYSHQFASARSISLRLRDIGATLPDGIYTYEVRLAPRVSGGVRMQLAAAREKGDDAALDRIRDAAGMKEVASQSGAFSIVNGSLVSSEASEPAAPKGPKSASSSGTASSQAVHNQPVKALDVVTADDAIIQGSLCVGLDCVNNESFGFDTIRLKENNTRIKFDDTSTSTGFPNHDWQLTANDSASGGANKFSVEDITASTVPMTITGSAPTNSIFVDSSGRLGLRTATPVLDVHISTSNTPAIRQEQTNAGGFTAQTWDIGGNEANWFVRDVTGGSRLPLRIRPGAPTSSIDIAASGNVGIGTASPGATLEVTGTGAKFSGTIAAETHADGNVYVGTFGSTPRVIFGGSTTYELDNSGGTFRIFRPGAVSIAVDNTGSITAPHYGAGTATFDASGNITSVSDERLKDIRGSFTRGLADILKIRPILYYYTKASKLDTETLYAGLSAQNLMEAIPEAVGTNSDGYHSVNDRPLIAALVNAAKELKAQNDSLSARVAELERLIHDAIPRDAREKQKN